MHHLQHVVRLDPWIYADNTNMFDPIWSSNALLVKIMQL
jgi:hypothetical protein